MLALAASWGVYSFAALYVPEPVAIIQAAAFELTYIGLAVTRDLDDRQRRRATAISVGAVVVSILYNSLDGLFHRNPVWLSGLPWYAEVIGAVLHGAPLAAVAYFVADLLLHSPVDAPMQDAQPPVVYARPHAVEEVHFSSSGPSEMQPKKVQLPNRSCPKCGSLLDAKRYASARRWGRCAACKNACR